MTPDPAALRQIAAQLQAGVVLNLYSPVAGKDKFHILIHAGSERSLAFIINTRPAPFVLKDPDRASRHIVIPKALHAFLDYDSHIACDEALGIACGPGRSIGTMQHVINAVVTNEAKIIGSLDRSMFAAVAAAAAGSRLIAPRDAVLIAAAFK